tara:strand:+ start:1690 stop:2280 length:591 start_codon:yes stop_codon:yes gene_type:complete
MKFKSHEELPWCTEEGFTVRRCPNRAWGIIMDAYNLLKSGNVKRREHFENIEDVILGENITTDFFDLENLPTIQSILHEELQQLHEEWSGHKLEPSAIYGIRSYNQGASLIQHVDRVATHHISCIIIVDKDLGNEEDWALEIQDPQGNWHSVYADVGDIILYESAKCSHGRNLPLKGNWFRNFYVHYKLKNWQHII